MCLQALQSVDTLTSAEATEQDDDWHHDSHEDNDAVGDAAHAYFKRVKGLALVQLCSNASDVGVISCTYNHCSGSAGDHTCTL